MDLHQVDDVGCAAARPSAASRRCRARGPVVHTLVARKAFGAQPISRDEIAGDRLGAAIHRRAVDHPAAGVEQQLNDLAQRLSRRAVVADIEGLPRAEADDGHGLAGGRDRTRDHRGIRHGITARQSWLRRRIAAGRRPRRQDGGAAQPLQEIGARDPGRRRWRLPGYVRRLARVAAGKLASFRNFHDSQPALSARPAFAYLHPTNNWLGQPGKYHAPGGSCRKDRSAGRPGLGRRRLRFQRRLLAAKP